MKNLFFILLLLFQVSLFSTSFTSLAEKEFKNFFKGDVKHTFLKFEIPKKEKIKIQEQVKQSFYKNWLYTWKIIYKNKNYYAVIDNVMGKQFPITFMVIFDSSGSVIFTKILEYRNTKGHGVKKESWLSQFNKKNAKSSFVYNKDVDGMSGATISAKSLTKGINKLCLLFDKISSSFIKSK